ncbi:DoxX family protein [Halalkalicoccus tibetensis]|uniref:DoxX family protein n=1 Tax=Halalkalicoccus tibetensis TaxID=175632 RepID=A0ABD5UZU6_9EURY
MDLRELFRTETSPWAFLIRFAVGFVFLTEGLNKLINPAERGVGRFEGLGLPAPELFAGGVAGIEIVAGTLLIAGLFTRAAALVLAGVALTAIVLTKLPVLLGTGFLTFGGVDASFYGLWGFLYEWRLDFAMFVGSIYLVLAGPGKGSFDERLFGQDPVLDRVRNAVRTT